MATDTKPSFSAARRWGLFFNVFLTIASVLAFVVMANYLASGYYKRVSLGAGSRADLSPQTIKVLQAITNDVTVSIFFDVHGSPEMYGWVSGLLKEYHNTNPRIKVETIDFTRFAADATARLQKYKLTNLKDKEFVVFECNGQMKTVYANELSDYNVSEILTGESTDYRRITFKGEMLFTPALFAVTHPRALKAYFLTGHGEHDPENTTREDGYAKFAALLKDENNVEWEKLSLQGTNEVPADCQLLIIAGPAKARFTENEITAIENYLNKGKRLFVLANNLRLGGVSGIETVLAKWGVTVEASIIVDEENVATRNDLLTAAVNPTHEVTKIMFSEALKVQMVWPRSLAATGNFKGADAPKISVLFRTGTNAIACFPVQGAKSGYECETNQFALAIAVEQGKIKGVSAGATRILVVGDSLCLDNQLLDSAANHYFAGFAVNWLLAQPSILFEGLGPRPVKEYRLNMTVAEAAKIRWIFLLGAPGAILLFGGLVWLRRRS